MDPSISEAPALPLEASSSNTSAMHPTHTKARPAFSDSLYQEMKDLIANCGAEANKHDLAIVTIEACIDNGINTMPHLIGFLQHLGFKRGHIAHVLNFETGSSRWRCAEGKYVINSA